MILLYLLGFNFMFCNVDDSVTFAVMREQLGRFLSKLSSAASSVVLASNVVVCPTASNF